MLLLVVRYIFVWSPNIIAREDLASPRSRGGESRPVPQSASMRAQISLEILVGMLLTLLVLLSLLHTFASARTMLADTYRELSQIAGQIGAYLSRMAD